MNKLKIAVSQFPVSSDIKRNEMYRTRHITDAAGKHADIVHFPETALTGYETDPEHLDWSAVDKGVKRICSLAARHKIFIVLGIHLKQPDYKKPFNSVLLISDRGEVSGVYSKTNLYGDENERLSCRKNFLVQEIKKVKCGFLICYDSCFPGLFTYYREQGVKVLFLSYCNAGSNSSSRYSRMPSGVAGPDGKLTCMKRHIPGIMVYDYPDENPGWMYDKSE